MNHNPLRKSTIHIPSLAETLAYLHPTSIVSLPARHVYGTRYFFSVILPRPSLRYLGDTENDTSHDIPKAEMVELREAEKAQTSKPYPTYLDDLYPYHFNAFNECHQTNNTHEDANDVTYYITPISYSPIAIDEARLYAAKRKGKATPYHLPRVRMT